MNPFNWNGPEFLAFYLILTVCLIGAQWWMRRTREAEAHVPANTPQLNDPYLVSYLAGGVNGLIRCVMVSLLERNVLLVQNTKEKDVVLDSRALSLVQSPLEGAVARFFVSPTAASKIFKGLKGDPAVTSAAEQYKARLEAAGLLPSVQQRSQNLQNALTVMLMLGSVAAVKLYLAYLRGHRNVAFLFLLGFAAGIASLVVANRRQALPGRQALQDLKQLFGGLKDRTKSGAFESVSPADVAFVTAVFGVAALGGSRQMYAKDLFPAAASSSGCGSGCGSSGGDGGGGSGCGGGGGCGGCGGS